MPRAGRAARSARCAGTPTNRSARSRRSPPSCMPSPCRRTAATPASPGRREFRRGAPAARPASHLPARHRAGLARSAGMALKDKIPLGMSLPHRSPDPLDMAAVRQVAQRAEALGFRDLWVTENTLDHVFCFDPVVVLTYAAAVTTKIRLAASVVVLAIHSPLIVAHPWAFLDCVS